MSLLKTQLWSPDTCKCQIEQVFDYDTKPATLVSQELVTTCPEHTGNDPVVIVKENTDKNKVMGKIVELLNIKNEDIYFSYEEGRILALLLPVSLGVQSKSDLEFELNKIIDKYILR